MTNIYCTTIQHVPLSDGSAVYYKNPIKLNNPFEYEIPPEKRPVTIWEMAYDVKTAEEEHVIHSSLSKLLGWNPHGVSGWHTASFIAVFSSTLSLVFLLFMTVGTNAIIPSIIIGVVGTAISSGIAVSGMSQKKSKETTLSGWKRNKKKAEKFNGATIHSTKRKSDSSGTHFANIVKYGSLINKYRESRSFHVSALNDSYGEFLKAFIDYMENKKLLEEGHAAQEESIEGYLRDELTARMENVELVLQSSEKRLTDSESALREALEEAEAEESLQTDQKNIEEKKEKSLKFLEKTDSL